MSRRAGLDRATVVRGAAALADEGGLEGVSLTVLAERLGVRTPSLYNHVAGLDGLRRELALLGIRELATRLGRAAVGKAGDEAIVALADAYRAFAREHPGLYAASLRAPAPDDLEAIAAADEVVALVTAALAAYGLRDDDALHAVRGLRAVIHGFVSLETNGGFGLSLRVDESFRRLLRTFTAGLAQGQA